MYFKMRISPHPTDAVFVAVAVLGGEQLHAVSIVKVTLYTPLFEYG